MRKTALWALLLILFPTAKAHAQTSPLSAPFICQWANIQGGCPGNGWEQGYPYPTSPADDNCGPTSVLMVASKWENATPTANQISEMDDWLQTNFAASWGYSTNDGKGSGTEPPELASLARNVFGIADSEPFSGWTLEQLKQELAQGYPVIVRVRPQMVWSYADAHYMVLLGMDSQFAYVNDPGIRNGADVKYKLSDFIQSWGRTAQWDGNNNEGVVIHGVASAQAAWNQEITQVSPSPRIGQAMAYDAAHNQVVIFGGWDGTKALGDTWVWNGTTWQDLTSQAGSPAPPPRLYAAMAYDAVHDQIVLFGGWNGSGGSASPFFDDTWVWNGTSWTEESPSVHPAAQFGASMAFDAVRDRVVLFNGAEEYSTSPETWLWDGTSWTQVSPPTSPPARFHSAMVFDASQGVVVLFGGFDSALPFPSVLQDTWVWDGSNWTQQFPATSPPARSDHAMAYDAESSDVVLFGGNTGQAVLGDTWTWDGTTWKQEFSQATPLPRFDHAMTYDSNLGEVVLFGGNGAGLGFENDTWVWH